MAEKQAADYIVLGHHRDDQAETFLLRLLRGSGLSGLSAMRHRRGRWLRPLLAASRQQLEDYAREQGLQWREDASNEDPRHLRNRVSSYSRPSAQHSRRIERMTVTRDSGANADFAGSPLSVARRPCPSVPVRDEIVS